MIVAESPPGRVHFSIMVSDQNWNLPLLLPTGEQPIPVLHQYGYLAKHLIFSMHGCKHVTL